MTQTEIISALSEVSIEITRINNAQGRTIFNPAATEMLRCILWDLRDGKLVVQKARTK